MQYYWFNTLTLLKMLASAPWTVVGIPDMQLLTCIRSVVLLKLFLLTDHPTRLHFQKLRFTAFSRSCFLLSHQLYCLCYCSRCLMGFRLQTINEAFSFLLSFVANTIGQWSDPDVRKSWRLCLVHITNRTGDVRSFAFQSVSSALSERLHLACSHSKFSFYVYFCASHSVTLLMTVAWYHGVHSLKLSVVKCWEISLWRAFSRCRSSLERTLNFSYILPNTKRT